MVIKCRQPDLLDYLAFYTFDAAHALAKQGAKEIKKSRPLDFWETLFTLGTALLCQYEKNSLNDELCTPIRTLFTEPGSSEIVLSPKKIIISKKTRVPYTENPIL